MAGKVEMIQFTNIFLREDKLWQFEWTDTGAEYYRAILQGEQINTAPIETNEFVYPYPGWEQFPPPLEIVEEEEESLSEQNLPFLVMQWYKEDGTAYYEVQEDVGGVWTTRAIIMEEDIWVYTQQTPPLADETTHNYRIRAVDIYEERSTDLLFRKFVVKPPTLSPLALSITYSEPNIVIDEV